MMLFAKNTAKVNELPATGLYMYSLWTRKRRDITISVRYDAVAYVALRIMLSEVSTLFSRLHTYSLKTV